MSRWVLLTYAVTDMLERQSSECNGRAESGGILIGAYRGPHIEITSFTVPGPKDIREPFKFIKQDDSHQLIATGAWRTSGGKDTDVGEWHTHPMGAPNPSTIDKLSWRAITKKNRRAMAFAIVAPAKWQLFWCEKRWHGVSVQPMVSIERGSTGIVFRPDDSWLF